VPVAVWIVATGGASAHGLTVCTNCTPTAHDDSYKTTFDVALTVSAPGLLANDSGPRSTQVNLTDSDTTSDNGAKVTVHTDGSFTYTPDPTNPFSGDDSFDYEISDSQGDTDTATANVEVDPIVHDVAFSTAFQTQLHVGAPGLLKPDAGVDSVDQSDAKSAHGGLVDANDDGSFDYTPPDGFSGVDSFTFTVNDLNFDNTFRATARITVGSRPVTTSTTAKATTTTTTVKATTTTTTHSGTTTTTTPKPSTTTTVQARPTTPSPTTSLAALGAGAATTPTGGNTGATTRSSLPFTGVQAAASAILALIAIDIGSLLIFVTRRRRIA
jgi:hypothetical protein